MRTHLSRGVERTIIGCIGDESLLAEVPLRSMPGVEDVVPVLKPYKLASREFAAAPPIVRVGDDRRGRTRRGLRRSGDRRHRRSMLSGEPRDAARRAREAVRDAGGVMLRGGAFKPRTSPYAFQGLGAERAQDARRRPAPRPACRSSPRSWTRARSTLVAEHADMLQVGARNMQNFSLLAELGRVERPVLLKRGLSATIKELLMAAEYIMAQRNHDVVLCERGIRTFETGDAQHARRRGGAGAEARDASAGDRRPEPRWRRRRSLVAPLAFAAIAAGADGLIVEVHPDPANALSDGDQSLSFEGVPRADAASGRVRRSSRSFVRPESRRREDGAAA